MSNHNSVPTPHPPRFLMEDLTSLEAESQVCEQVLTHLAQGTTPTHITSTAGNASDDSSASATATSILGNNSTTQDEMRYDTQTEAEHQKLLTVALSILLDSTSPGPDPLALQYLGWAYGMGGGGGMGDWDGCHYMPGSIGQTLRVLQDEVVINLVNKYSSMANLNETDYLSQKKAWWLQNHEVEYGKGYERSATRFCTIGGVTPWTVPYNRDGVLWGPPLAGVCVPSSCTANGLYMLFNVRDGFADLLLEMAAQSGGFYDDVNLSDNQSPPTASRRFRYMSSLAQSFHAGRVSRMGITCEGESGLPELDYEGYYSHGYYATVALIFTLIAFVFIGTASSGWFLDRSKDKNEDIPANNSTSNRTSVKRGNYQKGDGRDESLLMKRIPINHGLPTSTTSYGSNEFMNENGNGNQNGIAEEKKSVSFLFSQKILLNNNNQTRLNDNLDCILENDDEVEVETDPLLQSQEEIQFINIEEKRGIELQKSASFSLSERRRKYNGCMSHINTSILALKSCFAYFDGGQSFYEITRLTREDPYADSLHQQRLRKAGETSLDPSNSTPGLFPMYKALTPVRKGAIQPDQTVTVSSSKSLNGMRSISMLWIIFGHTLAVQSSVGYVNPAALLPPTGMMTSTLGKIVLSARYAVDTFFFIGGFLVMSGLLKKLDPAVGQILTLEEKTNIDNLKDKLARWGIFNPKHLVIGEYVNRLKQQASSNSSRNERENVGFLWVIPFLLHRILRILPTYGFVLLLWWKIAVTLGNGPFWPRWATFVAECDAHAWTNMLFINNIYPRDQPFGETSECMYHAWYLGVDFQLCLVLAPIFLTLYLRKGWRMRTIVLEILAVFIIIAASLYYSFKYKWSAHLWDGADTVAFDRGFYINPFFRSSPYIIGFITGQIWHEKCRLCPNVGLTKTVAFILSLISVAIMVYWAAFAGGEVNRRPCQVWESPHFADCGSGWSVTKLAIFNSIGRPVWGLGLALMSLLSFNGQLSFLWSSSILRWPGWDPMSKMSFSMYLLHPLIINVWILGGDDKFRFSLINLLFAFAGIVLITFIVAITIGVLVEWPMSRITRQFEKKLWSKKEKSDTSENESNNTSENSVNEEGDTESSQDHNQIIEENNNISSSAEDDYRYHLNLSQSDNEKNEQKL